MRIAQLREELLRRAKKLPPREMYPLAPYRPGARIRHSQKVRYQMKAVAWRESGGYCVYCLAPLLETRPFHLDHIKPRSFGGSDHQSNLLAACEACNCRRCNSDFIEFAERALSEKP